MEDQRDYTVVIINSSILVISRIRKNSIANSHLVSQKYIKPAVFNILWKNDLVFMFFQTL